MLREDVVLESISATPDVMPPVFTERQLRTGVSGEIHHVRGVPRHELYLLKATLYYCSRIKSKHSRYQMKTSNCLSFALRAEFLQTISLVNQSICLVHSQTMCLTSLSSSVTYCHQNSQRRDDICRVLKARSATEDSGPALFDHMYNTSTAQCCHCGWRNSHSPNCIFNITA